MFASGSPHRIESPGNPRIRAYRSLATPKGRRDLGRFQLEGLALIAEALKAGVPFTVAYWCPTRVREADELSLIHQLRERTEVVEVSERVLDHMASTVTPQPVVAEAPIVERCLDDIAVGETCLIVAPYETQDPGNLGTMIRTAHAMAATAVVALGNCVDVYAPKVVRATMGSLFHLPVVRRVGASEFVQWCAAGGLSLIAATPHAASFVHDLSFPPRSAILLGGETRGVPEELLGPDVSQVAIQMPGGTESLNVAVSAAILMYEYRRQYPYARSMSP